MIVETQHYNLLPKPSNKRVLVFQPEAWAGCYRSASNVLINLHLLGSEVANIQPVGKHTFPIVLADLCVLSLCEIVVWVLVPCRHLMPSWLHISSLLPGMLLACQKMSVLMLTAGFLTQVTFAARVLLLQTSAVYWHCAGTIKVLVSCSFVWSALCWCPSALPTLDCSRVCCIPVAEHTLPELSGTICSSCPLASAFHFSLHLC